MDLLTEEQRQSKIELIDSVSRILKSEKEKFGKDYEARNAQPKPDQYRQWSK